MVDLSRWLEGHAPQQGLDHLAPVISISAASAITALSNSALRKYESAGLIIFHRTSGNTRMLCIEDLERIKVIQHLIKRCRLNLEGILRLWALLPCWEFKRCSLSSRAECPALKDSDRPCWVSHQKSKGCEGQSCRTCEVYRFGAYCTEDLKSLLVSLQESEKSISKPQP
ncbi:MAG: MerR family transcriptional regulator [bacterium]|nr:MerR family transcriptional regulator [bacterium]